MKYYNTKQLINALSGKNKSFIRRIDKQQCEKYGNTDIFYACVDDGMVEIQFGDYSITFFMRNGEVFDTIGNGQGHKYHKSLEGCAVELYNKNY